MNNKIDQVFIFAYVLRTQEKWSKKSNKSNNLVIIIKTYLKLLENSIHYDLFLVGGKERYRQYRIA